MIEPSQLRFQPLWNNRQAFYDLACEYSCGLEIISFAMTGVINDPEIVRQRLSAYKEELPSLDCPKSLHGAFIDVVPHSADRAVREVARKRVYESLETAVELSCSATVFHTGINPLIRNPGYLPAVVDEQAAFWAQALRDFPGVDIYLENMWESDGSVFAGIIEKVGSDRLGICFDCGHANVFGAGAPADWMRELSARIPYMHWNDNAGDRDSELALGHGNINWEAMVGGLGHFSRQPVIVLEVGAMEKVRESLRYLVERGFLRAGR